MAGATYVVPGDAVYTDPTTGSRYSFHAGDVIALATAVRLQMPNASEPPANVPLITTITDPQDGDVLTYDAGSGTWTNVAPAGP